MSDVSQGDGSWVASDGRWYPPQDEAGSPSHFIPQGVVSSDSADERSTDPSAVAVATARQCVNDHEMPDSHIFCSVCGGEEWADSDDEQYLPGRFRSALHESRRWLRGGDSYVPVAETDEYDEDLDDDEVSVDDEVDFEVNGSDDHHDDWKRGEPVTQGTHVSMSPSQYCVACGNGLVGTAAICPRCGTPVAGSSLTRDGKSRGVAVVMAVFLSFWSFLYTYSKSASKFWLGLGLSVGSWIIIVLVTAATGGTPINVIFLLVPLGVWIWSIVDRATTPL